MSTGTDRAVIRAQEVCDLVQVQPYVLRTWEAEFPELGVAKSAGGPRVYRKVDVALVQRIKHLLFVDGLTLAGVRKQLAGEGLAARETSEDEVTDADLAAMVDASMRQELRDVRRGLQWVLGVLSGNGVTPEDRVLQASAGRASVATASSSKKSDPAAARKKRK